MQKASEPRVRVLTPGHVLIRTCSHREAVRLLRERKALPLWSNRKRHKAIIDPSGRASAQIPGGALHTGTNEHLADTLSVRVLLRVDGGAPETEREAFIPAHFRNWDQNLTFKELRAGKFVSAETLRLRAIERERQREDQALRYTGKGSTQH